MNHTTNANPSTILQEMPIREIPNYQDYLYYDEFDFMKFEEENPDWFILPRHIPQSEFENDVYMREKDYFHHKNKYQFEPKIEYNQNKYYKLKKDYKDKVFKHSTSGIKGGKTRHRKTDPKYKKNKSSKNKSSKNKSSKNKL